MVAGSQARPMSLRDWKPKGFDHEAPVTRVGFVQDFSNDNEEEREVALSELELWTKRPFEVVWHGTEREMPKMPDVDLLLVDYGGLHHAYGDAIEVYGRAVKRWADEHPGKLVLLWTAFTAACYKAVFEDFQSGEANILMRYSGAWDFDGTPGFEDDVRMWLGATRA